MGLSLKYVVLGMVVERPGYGYDLHSRIVERLPFLHYSQSAVYPALDRLEQEGLIVPLGAKSRNTSARANPRVVYASTPAGVDRFERWMYKPTPAESTRDELLARLPLMRRTDLPRLMEMARGQEADLRSRLRGLRESAGAAWTGSGPMPLQLVGARLVRSAEARRLSAVIESLQEIHDCLEHELLGCPPQRLREPGRRRA